jgi:hypothetical protein
MTGSPIKLPEHSIHSGDLMDRGMDKLRTVWLALSPDNKGWLDEAHLLAVWSTLDAALRDLEPVRNRLQGVEQPRQNDKADAPIRNREDIIGINEEGRFE